MEGYKTIIFAVLFGLVHIAGLFGFADYTPSGDVTEIVNIVAAVIMLVLRYITKGPVFWKAKG